jgi:hypothetical protein
MMIRSTTINRRRVRSVLHVLYLAWLRGSCYRNGVDPRTFLDDDSGVAVR